MATTTTTVQHHYQAAGGLWNTEVTSGRRTSTFYKRPNSPLLRIQNSSIHLHQCRSRLFHAVVAVVLLNGD
ncbi:hypothetical protein Hanom_Chr07g00669241 [Helianthus anomalus]